MLASVSKALKQTHFWPKNVIDAALHPSRFLSGVRYRLQGFKIRPAHALPASAADIFLPEYHAQFKELSFTFAVIALSAKVATANGKLTRDKYIAFRDAFPLHGEVCEKIRSLFIIACRNETPAVHYVSLIKYMFPGRPDLFISLVERLFRIASASGPVSRSEEQVLATIAHQLDISPADYSDMYSYYTQGSATAGKKQQAQHVMGVDHRTKAKQLKKRYHELMQRYHPDRFAGDHLSQEVQLLLQLKASEINAAYRALAKT